ncbi:MAG: hypothetical protein AAGD86_04410, partial [Pseudomonadota bacterium]
MLTLDRELSLDLLGSGRAPAAQAPPVAATPEVTPTPTRTPNWLLVGSALLAGVALGRLWSRGSGKAARGADEDAFADADPLTALKGRLDASRQQAQAAAAELAPQRTAAAAAFADFVAERDVSDEASATDDGVAATAADRLVAWHSAVTSLEAALLDSTRLLDARSDELDARHADYAEQREAISAHERVVVSMEGKLAERDDAIEGLEATVRDTERERDSVAQERDDLAQRLEAQERDSEALRATAASLEARLAEGAQAHGALDAELAQARGAIASLNEELDGERARGAELEAAVEKLTAEVKALEKRGEELDSARQRDAATLAAQAEELDAARGLATELADNRGALDMARDALKAAESTAAAGDEALRERDAQIEELTERVDAQDKQLTSLREQLSNSQERARAAEAEAGQASAELASARTGLETGSFQFNARLEEAMQLTAALEQRNDEAAEQIEELDRELAAARADAD